MEEYIVIMMVGNNEITYHKLTEEEKGMEPVDLIEKLGFNESYVNWIYSEEPILTEI